MIIESKRVTEGLAFNRIEGESYYYCVYNSNGIISMTEEPVSGKTDTINDIVASDNYNELVEHVLSLGV
jgi:hypothetical protein